MKQLRATEGHRLAELLQLLPPAQEPIKGWQKEAAGKPAPQAQSISFQQSIVTALESEATVAFDTASLNPHYAYSDEHVLTHRVWMLDAVTAYNELRACDRLGVQGTALWRLGSSA